MPDYARNVLMKSRLWGRIRISGWPPGMHTAMVKLAEGDAPASAPFCIDKSEFIKVWWSWALDHPNTMIIAPAGFGKTHLLQLVSDFFGKSETETPLLNCQIGLDKDLIQEHCGKYSVSFTDFSKAAGESFEEAHENLEVKGQDFMDVVTGNGLADIILLDNIDAFLLNGFMDDYFEEAFEFMEAFLMDLFRKNDRRKAGSKILMTATSRFFLDYLASSLEDSIKIFGLYDSIIGPFLGIRQGAMETLLLETGKNGPSLGGILRKFGGFRVFDSKSHQPLELIHPSGLARMFQAEDSLEAAKVNAFEPILLSLVDIFRKMNLNHRDLYSLFHSKAPVQIQRPKLANDPDKEEPEFSFYDFIKILHDFGVLAYHQPSKDPSLEMSIPNADAELILIRMSNIFMQEDINDGARNDKQI